MNFLGRLEKIKKRVIRCDYPAPLFFDGDEPDLEKQIEDKLNEYRRQGYSEKAINETPVYIEDELAE